MRGIKKEREYFTMLMSIFIMGILIQYQKEKESLNRFLLSLFMKESSIMEEFREVEKYSPRREFSLSREFLIWNQSQRLET